MRPDDYKYSETHEWIKYNEKKKEATIGITDYAVKQLSDLVHLELPKVGDTLEQGAPFGEIESVKTVADLVSPLSGKVIEVNKEVAADLDILKEEPFEDGWLIKIKPSDPSELESLMTKKEYEEFLESAEEEEEEESDDSEDVDEDDFV
ncbi:MAG TPA: glycine cleavage system protein GcvH [Planctomycetota bacterium]|jgi:glycine cleavage system H protein|nr:glycine cleavage system protein GcvH [Planctomycetota bacterium]